jgi:hypothetical protein
MPAHKFVGDYEGQFMKRAKGSSTISIADDCDSQCSARGLNVGVGDRCDTTKYRQHFGAIRWAGD